MTTWEEQVADWDRAADGFVRSLLRFAVSTIASMLPYTVRRRYGRATALNTSSRTVAVTLEGSSDESGAPTGSSSITADFGRPTWSAGRIVNKRVAVWETRQWVADDLRLRQLSVNYVVDDVVSV